MSDRIENETFIRSSSGPAIKIVQIFKLFACKRKIAQNVAGWRRMLALACILWVFPNILDCKGLNSLKRKCRIISTYIKWPTKKNMSMQLGPSRPREKVHYIINTFSERRVHIPHLLAHIRCM